MRRGVVLNSYFSQEKHDPREAGPDKGHRAKV